MVFGRFSRLLDGRLAQHLGHHQERDQNAHQHAAQDIRTFHVKVLPCVGR